MTSKKINDAGEALFRIPPHFYIHVLDLNTNVTRLVVGPQTFFRQDHERVVFGPEKMIIVPPRHYCIIENPSVKDKDNKVVVDDIGQVRLVHSDQEIRLAQDPFPLYPGEEIKKNVSELNVVPPNSALRLKAILDLEDDTGEKRTAGDEWLFEGPGTYIPKKEVMIEETIRATVIKPNQAIRLCARRDCVDIMGNEHVTGEEWLTQKVGAYLPGAYEKVVDIVNAYVLSETKALHIRSLMAFKDDFGVKRKNGEEWLITMDMTGTHIPHVYEEVMGVVNLISLTHRQYCVIINPVDDKGRPQLGKKKLVKGEKSFFLMPGERLERDIQDVYVLEEDEALVLKALETFTDDDKERKPGDRWMTYGPTEFVPPVEVEVVVRRRAIPLDVHDGVYVRNIKTGKVRAVTGETYMLSQEEELWEKALPPTVEAVMQKVKDPLHNRSDKSRVIAFRVPQSSAVQIYDYKDKKARVVFGPELVLLGPYEQFTQFTTSGCRGILMALNNSFWNVMSKGFKMIAG